MTPTRYRGDHFSVRCGGEDIGCLLEQNPIRLARIVSF